MPWLTCGGQRTTCRTTVLFYHVIEHRSSGLSKCLYSLSHLNSPPFQSIWGPNPWDDTHIQSRSCLFS